MVRTSVTPTIDIVVCTRNHAALLEKTLTSFCGLAPASIPHRILVIDNGSTDDTSAVIGRFTNRLPLSSNVEERPGLSVARNRALDISSADYILWTDDDVTVPQDWLVQFVRAIQQFPSAAVIGGRIIPDFEETPDPDLVTAFPVLGIGYCGLDYQRPAGILPPGGAAWGANIGMKRQALRDLRFSEHLGPTATGGMGGDETELQARVERAGGTICWWPDMFVRHWVPRSRMTLEYLQAYTRAKGRDTVTQELLLGTARPEGKMPAWLVKELVTAFTRESLVRIGLNISGPPRLRSGPVPSGTAPRRVKVLSALRERLYLQGMLQAFKQRV